MSKTPTDSELTVINSILTHWFGTEDEWDGNQAKPAAFIYKKWYSSDSETDKYLTEHYKDALVAVANGVLDHWFNDHKGCLAAIILCD